jgi:hypothetical protein
LNTNYLNKIKSDLGFNDITIIEKFIMDYEILFHILKMIPDSIIKGGMSVPLHIPEMAVRRLSEDIDLVTRLSEKEVKSAMKEVVKITNGLFHIPEPHKPVKPTKFLPLLTYYITYSSSIGSSKPEVQVDIFYDFKDTIPTKLINPVIELMDFKLDYPVTIFDKGSLIGDKITTLGFDTIGLPEDRRSDAIKHIYDIGLLIRLIDDKISLKVLIDVYKKTADYENSFKDRKFNDREIIDDIFSSLDSLLISSTGYALESTHKGRYSSFKQQLLRNSNLYTILYHINDILLIKLLSSYLRSMIYGKITLQEFTDEFYDDISKLKSIILKNPSEKGLERKQIIQSFNSNNGKNFIKTLPLVEQVFLFSKIEKLRF